jgi:truncated hemoglobin YjbI
VEPSTATTVPLALAALTPESEEQRLEAQLVAGGLSEDTRKALLDQLNTQAAQNTQPQTPPRDALLKTAAQSAAHPASQKQAANALEKQDQLLAGLLLGSPEFQRR